jgi:hypothetical protein
VERLERKVERLEAKVERLEEENRQLKRTISQGALSSSPPPRTSFDDEHATSISKSPIAHTENSESYSEEESGFLTDETQPRYIGEAACTTFGSRLHQYLTADDSLPTPRHSHYYRNHRLYRQASFKYQLPNRVYAHRLVKAVLRFMYGLFKHFVPVSAC